jgi:hypothetical protein
MKLLTKTELDSIHCDNPECSHKEDDFIHIHPDCHPGMPVHAAYDKIQGALVLCCAICGKPLVMVKPGD